MYKIIIIQYEIYFDQCTSNVFTTIYHDEEINVLK